MNNLLQIIPKNIFIQFIIKEEKLAVERANNIKKKYRMLRDLKTAKKLDLIYKSSSSDEELAKNLQLYYYN